MTVCMSCNEILSPFEDTRKYLDMDLDIGLCNDCFHTTDINGNTVRLDLVSPHDYEYIIEEKPYE